MRTLTDNQRDEILDVIDAGLTKIPASALEKDIHLTKVLLDLATLSDSTNLVFCGGTSLSKCYQLIDRMSEDIDFKFHIKPMESKAKSRETRKEFSQKILLGLETSGFEIVKLEPRSEYKFFSIEAKYKRCFEETTSLREEILLEFTHVDEIPQTSRKIIREIVNEVQLLDKALGEIECLTLEQTVAEKTLSFLRRATCPDDSEFDKRIIRHLYDIEAILRLGNIDQPSLPIHFETAQKFDAERYGSKVDLAELLERLKNLEATKPRYAQLFEEFVTSLTTDNVNEFEKCWDVFMDLLRSLLK